MVRLSRHHTDTSLGKHAGWVSLSLDPLDLNAVRTLPRPRSDCEVVAQILATTEQSVSTSCTRSVVFDTDMTDSATGDV